MVYCIPARIKHDPPPRKKWPDKENDLPKRGEILVIPFRYSHAKVALNLEYAEEKNQGDLTCKRRAAESVSPDTQNQP